MKNIYKGMVAATLLATATLANAGTVSLPGGVTFNEIPTTNADFGQGSFRSTFDFVQWWEDSAGTDTGLSTMFGGSVIPTDYNLNGYGELNVNDATGSFLCNGCELTFAFGGLGLTLTTIDNPVYTDGYATYLSFVPGSTIADYEASSFYINNLGAPTSTVQSPGLDLTNATMSIYLDSMPNFDIGINAFGDRTNATDGTEWLKLAFKEVDFGVVAANADVAVAGLNRADSSFGLDVIGGIAAPSFLNADDIRDLPILNTFVDLIGFGLSGNFVKSNGSTYDTYSVGGSGTASGFAVPEPASIAIFGLGLLGFAGMARRKKS